MLALIRAVHLVWYQTRTHLPDQPAPQIIEK